MFYGLPNFFKTMLKFIIRLVAGKRFADNLKNIKEYSSEEIDEAFFKKMELEREFNQRWREEKIDALICPSFFHSAFETK